MKHIRHTEEEMKAIYAQWQQSGLNKKEYCQQAGIEPSKFFYWAKKFRANGEPPSSGFLELDLSSQTNTHTNSGNVFLEIEYPSGARLKLYGQAEASWVKSLLEAN
jgi:hypothetical protein